MQNEKITVHSINGPVVTAAGRTGLAMLETVRVGRGRLIGEVISVSADGAVIQVYESTTGLKPGEPIYSSGAPMSCLLGPGLLSQIFDGIARPLRVIEDLSGPFIAPGADAPSVDLEKLWDIKVKIQVGDRVAGGQIAAVCGETPSIEHRIMIPPGVSGEVIFAENDGAYNVSHTLAKVRGGDGGITEIAASQRWPIRVPRPIVSRLPASEPLVTGQRVIDTLFPIAKGGAAAIPGGFGTGKTMLQHQLAKWSDADIIVYVGCGERGNEMTGALTEFSELSDPRTGRSMLERTILIANTSNMPVAAREASIYTGITIAEYYRDMGYSVALMADSTSRWAEALREISGRLEEMPAEEGYPAYLPSRLSAFYERSGSVRTLSGGNGSVTVIGAVSPQGNDFSEPVTQNTRRFIRCFWALDKSLAYARHYPAINYGGSYSEYADELAGWYRDNIAPDWSELRGTLFKILSEEDQLMEIVKLIGSDLLADEQKLVLETAKLIKTGFLQQNAMHPTDCYAPPERQYAMLRYIIMLHESARTLVAGQIPVSRLRVTGCFEKLARCRYSGDDAKLSAVWDEIEESFAVLRREYGLNGTEIEVVKR